MDYVSLIGIIATPVVIILVASMALVFWRSERRVQYRVEQERWLLEQERLARDAQLAREERERQDRDRQDEFLFRRATFIPEDDPDGVFLLHISTSDPVAAVRLVAAAQELYASKGFERPEITSVEPGSVKVKFRTRIANLFREPATREVVQELRIAAEQASIGRVIAENNERNSNAATQLIRAMSDFDGAAEMITPTMAVVKSFDEDGRPLIVVRVPTAHELVELRRSDDANGHKALSTRTAIAIEPSPDSTDGSDPH